jgi:hypothetical protein
MQLTRLSLGVLTLLLLVIIPVNGAPALQRGSQASYSLSVSISFSQSCQPVLSSTFNAGIICPMIAMVSPSSNINGTLSWTVTDLNATTANLNVTRDIATSTGDVVTPITQHAGSFNESIRLSTRIATILPFIEPELDQALQMTQTNTPSTLPAGSSWGSIMSALDATLMRQPIHTMWWVNGPLKVNDSVPVLVFPTNVTGSTSLDLGGSIGSRSAWTLVFPSTGSLLPPDPMVSMTSMIPIANNFKFALTFNYDQTSDLLLSASAHIHLGLSEETTIQPSPCTFSTTMVCPVSSPISIMRGFGIDVHASLMLTSTTLDLSQRLTSTNGSQPSNGSNPGSTTSTGPGDNQGSGPGSAPTPNPGSNPSSSGYDPVSGSTPTGAGQPSSNPAQSKPSAQSAGLVPWMYGILGIISAAILASAVWIARRRTKKAPSQVGTVQPPD